MSNSYEVKLIIKECRAKYPEYRSKPSRDVLEDRIKVLRKEAAKIIDVIFTSLKEIDHLQSGWIEPEEKKDE